MFDDSITVTADQDYWSRRHGEERRAAESAADPAVRRIHAALADGYAERLRAAIPVAG